MTKLTPITLFSCIVSLLINCSVQEKSINNDYNIFINVIDSILLTDYTAILNENKNDLLLATYLKKDTFKLTLMEKRSYPKYLYYFPYLSKPKKNYIYKNVSILNYGEKLPISVQKINPNHDIDYLTPYAQPNPPKGQPPSPPPSIEPLIYTYLLKADKAFLIRKNVADKLF